jgi:hypothetical protein
VSTFVCHVSGSTFLCQGIQSKVKFRNYDCHYKLIDPIEIPVSELIKDILVDGENLLVVETGVSGEIHRPAASH